MDVRVIEDFTIAINFLKSTFSSPTHWPDWNLIVSEYFNTFFYYLGAFENEKLVGICPVHELKTKRNLLTKRHSGHFQYIPYGSWIFSEPTNISLKSIPSGYRVLNSIQTLPVIPEFNALYHQKGLVEKQTLLIDLANTKDFIWSNFINSKRRNMIRKAQTSGIKLVTAKAVADINAFYKLYINASQRLGLGTLPEGLFHKLFFESKNIELNLFLAYFNNVQVANIAVLSDKNYSFYWLGNNLVPTENFGQGELLQWEAINHLKAKGCKYYDLCVVDAVKLPHIYTFKKGFSNKATSLYYYKSSSFYYKLLNRLIK
jgi:hypothetical protein